MSQDNLQGMHFTCSQRSFWKTTAISRALLWNVIPAKITFFTSEVLLTHLTIRKCLNQVLLFYHYVEITFKELVSRVLLYIPVMKCSSLCILLFLQNMSFKTVWSFQVSLSMSWFWYWLINKIMAVDKLLTKHVPAIVEYILIKWLGINY